MTSLPFSPQQFFAVFARYNESVWPAQLVLFGLALACTWLVRSNRPRAVASLLAVLWLWMAFGFHFAFFSSINPAAFGFGALFVIAAAVFLWSGVVRSRLQFRRMTFSRSVAGYATILYALVGYPALGYALGQVYPAAPTFGLPCPTTIFTLGILMLAQPAAPRELFVVPLLWSVIGSMGALQLGVPEDYGLLAAGLLALSVGVLPSRDDRNFTHPPANDTRRIASRH